jgi:hypothetical protein
MKVVLHEFTMGDVDDLEVYAAQPIYEWQQTDAGKWCMKNATDIHWVTAIDHNILGHRIKIIGTLSGKYATYYAFKRA